MGKARQSWVAGNQFTPETNSATDFEVNSFLIPVGSTLNRTWVDVRFNQFGTNDLPPEFVNQTGPLIWGICMVDEDRSDPGVFAEDDAIDWIWREMVRYDAPVATVPDASAEKQWVRSAKGGTGPEGSQGQRKMNHATTFLHWCFDIPTTFGSSPRGHLWEVFVHTIWTVP